jgi:uncharacterized cupin superfamily protein
MPAAKRSRFPLLTAAAIAKMVEIRKVHALNKRAIRHGKSLGDAVGMRDLGIHLVRVAPGHESTEYHTHSSDEEFVYILSGRGIAEIGKRKIKVGPGDFMGFAANSLPHTMTNPYKEDLCYLMGGTRKPIDITEYTRSRKRLYKFDGKRHMVRFKDVKES